MEGNLNARFPYTVCQRRKGLDEEGSLIPKLIVTERPLGPGVVEDGHLANVKS